MHKLAVRSDFIELCRTRNIKSMCEVGSRDARDSMYIAKQLSLARVTVFECNPKAVELCGETIAREAPAGCRVALIPKAVSDSSGTITFRPVIPSESSTEHADGNIGASSILRHNPEYPVERLKQSEIEVPCSTLDAHFNDNESYPELLWVDVEGMECSVCRGARETLARVKIAHVEVTLRELHLGSEPYFKTHRLLVSAGLRLHKTYFGQPPVAERLVALNRFFPLSRWLSRGPWIGDVVYVRD